MLVSADKLLNFIRQHAGKFPQIKKIILFGSRARGDFRTVSDYDFAVEGNKLSHADWSRFSVDVEELAPTLCGIDLVLMNDELSEDLKREIQLEGRVVYESS